jgi:mxaD protein
MRSPSCFTPGLVTRVIGTCLVSACLMSSAFAHGPTPKKIDETVTIAAAPDVVWKKLADFGAISTWHPDISANRSYSYRMDQENVDALPVSSYSATIVVKPAGQGSEVSWSGRFYRGDTNNEPPENLNDEAAIKAMDAFFKHGLAGLKNVSEGKAK